MAKTIFSASQQKQKKQQAALESELKKIQQEYQDHRASHPTDVTADNYPTQRSKPPEAENQEPAVTKQAKAFVKHSHSAHEDTTSSHDQSQKVEAREKKTNRTAMDYSQVMRESGQNSGWFAAFMPRPRGMHFETQHEQEQLLLVLRQHPIVNVPWIVLAILMLFAPFVIFPIIPLFAFLPAQFAFFTFIAWYLFFTIYVVESFLHWYFNIYIITDERIIDIDFYSMIYKAVSEAKIEKIEDVTATTAGFLGAMFNYGTIVIQTAAETRQFEFAKVPQPSKVTKFLNELILEEEREKIEGRVM